MAVTKSTYATAASATITLTSLADGNWRQSAVVDNTSNLYLDAWLGGSIQVGTSPTDGNTISIYLYGTYDGTNYTAGASGTDLAYTADGEETLLRLADVITVDATSDQDYVWGPVSVSSVFGNSPPGIPSKWGVVVKNDSGAALNATGTNNEVQFVGLTLTTA